jgi:hypothetical protein
MSSEINSRTLCFNSKQELGADQRAAAEQFQLRRRQQRQDDLYPQRAAGDSDQDH